MEDQVTYPLTTTLLSVPHAKTVRGYSLFGESFVYVLFEDGVDLYWARSRVLEYLSQVQGRLPVTARAALGPDATGVGWIYEYALVDRTGKNDISQLRALQDWFLKYELKTVPNVAEVATIGGFNRQYQIVLDPDRLRAYGLTVADVTAAVRASNDDAGGRTLELSGREYAIRGRGYLAGVAALDEVTLRSSAGVPVRLGDVARVELGADWDGAIALQHQFKFRATGAPKLPEIPKTPIFELDALPGVEAFDFADIALDSEPDINVGLGTLQDKARAIAKSVKDPARRARVEQAIAQLGVLLIQPTKLDDDLVQEVIDLVLVVALAELGRLETLVDDVFRGQSHGMCLSS